MTRNLLLWPNGSDVDIGYCHFISAILMSLQEIMKAQEEGCEVWPLIITNCEGNQRSKEANLKSSTGASITRGI